MGPSGPPRGTDPGQEGALNCEPAEPLAPGTTYEIVVPAGGVLDASGNLIETPFRATFTTVGCP